MKNEMNTEIEPDECAHGNTPLDRPAPADCICWNPIAKQMIAAGWCRCPNNSERWYPAHAGMLEPAYPMEIRVTDEIWLVARMHGGTDWFGRLMRFDSVSSLEKYLERHGVKAGVQ